MSDAVEDGFAWGRHHPSRAARTRNPITGYTSPSQRQTMNHSTDINRQASITQQDSSSKAQADSQNMVDYGYEEHTPSPKRHTTPTMKISGMLDAPYLLEPTETSTSCSPVELKESDFPPIPADRQARKQRSFHRRGGEGHSALLRAAVMASMDDSRENSDDGTECHLRAHRSSSISLQSLQEALSETTSPKKRARHAGIGRSFSSIDFESEEEHPEETDEDSEEDEDDHLHFSENEEDDEQILQTSADLNGLAMSTSFATLRQKHHRSFSGSMVTNKTSLLDSSLTSLPDFRSSLGSRRQSGRRWVSRRTSYDSWASVCSDYSVEDDL